MSIRPGGHLKHYAINDRIAKGGMGVVWQAVDIDTNELVAIKAVANDLFYDPDFRVRIQDEANRHLRLKHENIVPVLDVFESHGSTCIVMKLIRGLSLDSLLKKNEDHRLEEHIAIPIVGDILNALDYAHRSGIFHRDVKPSNVLLEKDNRALLIDFGIALAVGEERRTRTGVVVGTTLYMSPEQIIKPKSIDHRSDVYSVGCVIYEMLSGQTPFVKGRDGVGDTDFEIQQAHVKKRPVSPRSRRPSISAYLDELIMQALEKDPDNRIPGCQEFIRLLQQAGKHSNGGQKVTDLKGDQIRHRKIKLVVGVSMVLLLGFIVLIIVLNL